MREKRALAKDEIIKKKEKCIHNAQMKKKKMKNKYQNDLTYKIEKINEVKQRQKEMLKSIEIIRNIQLKYYVMQTKINLIHVIKRKFCMEINKNIMRNKDSLKKLKLL